MIRYFIVDKSTGNIVSPPFVSLEVADRSLRSDILCTFLEIREFEVKETD